MPRPIITLTTDFGTSDPFVGVMKGVILSINPDATVVDITHDVPPQDVRHAAFVFASAYRYFPPSTIHVIIVDPGVGTSRRPLLVQSPAYWFVCPDNGLLSLIVPSDAGDGIPPDWSVFELTDPAYWLSPVSHTFHGRDIFAPVAAHLSSGVAPAKLGDAVGTVMRLAWPTPQKTAGGVDGEVVLVDRFGNLITNIPIEAAMAHGESVAFELANHRVHGLSPSYQSTAKLVAVPGSHGYIEVAAPNGSAARTLGAGVGERVRVRGA